MTYLLNKADDFADEAVRGLVAAHPDLLVEVPGGVARASQTPEGQPALVIGGGSGHYPAFAGWVGPGMGHGAPCGNIFSSPSASEVYSVVRNAENGGGVILGFGNYAGDVLHFGMAAEKLRHEGIDVRIIRVSDDIASNGPENHRDRRGVAGDLPVFKIAGAAIEAGADLDEAERLAWKANDATRSFGLAFDGCTLPGAGEPLFHVEKGRMGVGLGIHGEPGIRDEDLGTAADVADLLVDAVLAEEPPRGEDGYDGRVAVILNGLGTVKYEELFVVYGRVAQRLEEKGLTAVRPEVGEFVTSLDMAGLSLTVVFLDQELETLWTAPVETPAYRRGAMPDVQRPPRTGIWDAADAEIPEAGEESRACARRISEVLGTFERVCADNESELGRLDAVAGDGDHGQGMTFGSRGAARAARDGVEQGAGARTTLLLAGQAWADSAGGTSGALWGAALASAGGAFTDTAGADEQSIVDAVTAGIDAVLRLGGARPGDKTMVDAAVPFREALTEAFEAEAGPAIVAAAQVARDAADKTAEIAARLGRARVLGEKSLGTPDPGALSFALLMAALGEHLTG
ncbi:D-erythrulose kinase [Mycobacterium sp. 852013-51886_SCH5428379]|uniref:L-erythrulose 1-kinase n=1 Tax=Mycobacterium sp. 852013-51886_SCH5428379 TaxID=1834111 RepID=UPI0008003383|nr:L-erythrulose 1-kinase [Mycobacterium sp. 852013-51886_SCH5428379]OBB58223.1 D-erythrulose kinase [Mycobacterium sp. 852013-51886_SCH5428379]